MNNKIINAILLIIILGSIYFCFTFFSFNGTKQIQSSMYEQVFAETNNIYKLELISSKSPFKLYAYIYEMGCPSCNKYVVQKVSELYKKYDTLIDLNVFGGSKNYVKALGYNLNYKILTSPINFLGLENINKIPLLILADKNGVIHKIKGILPGDYAKYNNWFKSIDSFFESLTEYKVNIRKN